MNWGTSLIRFGSNIPFLEERINAQKDILISAKETNVIALEPVNWVVKSPVSSTEKGFLEY